MLRNFTLPFAPLLVLCACLLLPCSARAAEHMLTPGINLKTVYDDNVFFDEASDFELIATPSLEYSVSGSRTSLGLTAAATVYRYLEHTRFDRVNQDYGLNMAYDISPNVSTSFQGSFGVDHSFESFLEETGIVVDKNKRFTYRASQSVSWTLNARNTLSVSPFASHTDFREEDGTAGTDHTSYGLSLSLSHQWSARTVFSGSLSASRSETDDDVQSVLDVFGNPVQIGQFDLEQTVYQASLGMSHSLTENLDLSLSGGASYSQLEYTQRIPISVSGAILGTASRDVDEDDLGGTFDASLSWQQEYYSLGLTAGRSISQDPDGDLITRDRVGVSADWELTASLKATLSGSFVRSDSVETGREDTGQDSVDTYSYSVSPGLSYSIGEHASLNAGYTFRAVDDGDESETSNRAFVGFSYSFPVLL